MKKEEVMIAEKIKKEQERKDRDARIRLGICLTISIIAHLALLALVIVNWK